MPLVKIEIVEGVDRQSLLKIKEVVMNAVVESLLLPLDDRNIRLSEYKSDFFEMKKPYEMLVEITLFLGRTKETKRKLFLNVVNSLESNGLMTKEKVFIVLNEQPLENWGVRGGIPADEIKMNFKVDL